MGKRLAWYVRRLSAMAPAEIGWRFWCMLVQTVAPPVGGFRRPLFPDLASQERALSAFRGGDGAPLLLDQERARQVFAEQPREAARLVTAAERVLAGRVQFFGYPEVVLEQPVDWSRDGITGFDWPDLPSSRLDHRSAPADPKWVWELNRLQHLPWLAQAYLATGREQFAEEALTQLDSWIDQNPVGRGIAWRGAFEAGVRAISVAVALQGLRGSTALTSERYARIVEMLRSSGRMCWRERSLFSSANNHLVGEMAGLAVVAMLFPELPEARRWQRRALRQLCAEADRQLLPDGAGAEQAIGYQVFTAELLLVVAVLCRAGPSGVAPSLDRAVARSAGYLSALVGDKDPAPRYGDYDDGFALRLGAEELRTVRDHLGIVASVGSQRPVTTGGLTAGWFRAAAEGRPGSPLVPGEQKPSSWHAPDGGLVVLRHDGQRLTMDVGPLGYLSLAAHGHADALSLTLAMDGEALIDDPGTGSYYGHPAWRQAHRSTRAHATATVDDEDQSLITGPFMWSGHARVTVHEIDLGRGLVDAEHDGYRRLREPVTHRRRVEAPEGLDGFVVVDVIRGSGWHRAAVSWPLAPDLAARVDQSGHVVSRLGSGVMQVATAGSLPVAHSHVVGDEDSQLGWWSDRLESRQPSYLLTSTVEGRVPLVLATVVRRIGSDGALPVTDLEVEMIGTEARVTWREHGQLVHTAVDVRVAAEPH